MALLQVEQHVLRRLERNSQSKVNSETNTHDARIRAATVGEDLPEENPVGPHVTFVGVALKNETKKTK